MVSFGEKYQLFGLIGSGSCGEIYEGIDRTNGDRIAAKLESRKKNTQKLFKEYKIYEAVQYGDGFPQIKHYEEQEKCNILVMELLGQSLTSMFEWFSNKFSLGTVLLLADQMLQRLEYLHSKNIIHRDIKPDNFMFGMGNNRNKLYLIDFSLSKEYRCKNDVHIPKTINNSFAGNFMYSSVWALCKCEQSRRDDLEALGYLLIHLFTGSLPWLTAHYDSSERARKEIAKQKLEICETLKDTVPEAFLKYIETCRLLKFTEDPPYSSLRQIFKDLYDEQNYGETQKYDWDLIDGDSAYSTE